METEPTLSEFLNGGTVIVEQITASEVRLRKKSGIRVGKITI